MPGVYSADFVIPEVLYTKCPDCGVLFEIDQIEVVGLTRMAVLTSVVVPDVHGEAVCEYPECEASWMFVFGVWR